MSESCNRLPNGLTPEQDAAMDQLAVALAENARHADAETLPTPAAPSPGVPEIRDNRDEPDRSALTLQPGSDHLLDYDERG